MGQIKKTVSFKAPLEKVWAIWVDVEKTPEWVAGVEESKITSSGKIGKGLEWSEKCLFGSKNIQMEHKFTEWEEGKKTVIESGLPMGGRMERVVEFKAIPDGCEANVEVEWDLGIVGAFFDEAKLQHMMEKSFNQTAEKWKAKAES